jgi:hypothetical protein
MRKVKHNKIRNTGLLFEFLLRQITSDVLNKDNSNAVEIVKKDLAKTQSWVKSWLCITLSLIKNSKVINRLITL